MSRVREAVISVLADAREHSGSTIASRLGVTRAAVGRQVRVLREQGYTITGRAGGGYRLVTGPRMPLRRERITDALRRVDGRLASVEVCGEADSTNDRVTQDGLPSDGRAHVCVADHQTAGRGRRGRDWLSVPGGSITLSIARSFPVGPAELAPLGLVAGIATAEALRAQGVPGVGLKWPNDIFIGGAKLGGILVEVRGEADGPTRGIIGIGLNYIRDDAAFVELDRSTTDIWSNHTNPPPRDELAGGIIDRVVRLCDEFVDGGFAAVRQRWTALDVLVDRPIRVTMTGGDAVDGRARGIDAAGALVVETKAGRRRFLSGEVSVRAAP